MKKILVGNNNFALVDDSDYDRLREHKWSLSPTGYAMTTIGGRVSYMHRLLLDVPKNLECDHRNGNHLDNQRANIRICTHGQNMAARRMHHDNKSGFKGVTFEARSRNKWHAQICKDKEIIRIGNYATPEEAARAYDRIARAIHGEFATVNFPEERQ
jgi:hypothetical protein